MAGKTCLLLLVLAAPGIAQTVVVPAGDPLIADVNAVPFGGPFAGGFSYLLRIPASSLDPNRPVVTDVAFLPDGSGTWSAQQFGCGIGHLPAPLPCPVSLPTQAPASTGSFLGFTTLWAPQNGPFSWTATQDQWSPLGLPGTFTWNGVDDVGVYLTFQNATLSGWLGGCRSSTTVPRRSWSTGFAAGGPASALDCEQGGGLRVRLDVACTVPGPWQTNQAGATLTIDGLTNDSCAPVRVVTCPGAFHTVALTSLLLTPAWDLGVVLGPGVPAGAPGSLVTGSGQALNLSLPATSWTFGLGFTNAFAPWAVPVQLPAPIDVSAQMVVANPSHPDGFNLSAPGHLRAVLPAPVPGPIWDDAWVQVDVGVAPMCTSRVSFYGSGHTRLFVNTNGTVSFETGAGDWTPTPLEWANGPPRIGWWAPLSVQASGTVTVTGTPVGLTVAWSGVAPRGAAVAAPSSFEVTYDAGSGAWGIRAFAPGAGFAADSLLGITAGNGALDPGSFAFAPAAGLGPQPGLPGNACWYELAPGGAPAGFNEVVFPNGDASVYVVN